MEKYCIVADKEYEANPGGYAFMFANDGCCCRNIETYFLEDEICPPDTYSKEEAEEKVEGWNRTATFGSVKYKVVPYTDVAVFIAEAKLRYT